MRRQLKQTHTPLHIRIETHCDCPLCHGSKTVAGLPCQYWGSGGSIISTPLLEVTDYMAQAYDRSTSPYPGSKMGVR